MNKYLPIPTSTQIISVSEPLKSLLCLRFQSTPTQIVSKTMLSRYLSIHATPQIASVQGER